ncbi:OCRL [Cordylochernes scorpioides]|uniref:OCRL n=1 Tax=Cordylochernes scorpioides TaxID=51811 RepID=A0ABY6L252_9ARAC|nr:OCRL [Cordylochernes scorpioides]
MGLDPVLWLLKQFIPLTVLKILSIPQASLGGSYKFMTVGNRMSRVVEDLPSPDFSNLPRDSIAMGATPLAARESVVRLQMAMREEFYTDLQNFRIFCGTWNVNGQYPSCGLREWLACDPMPPDMYAIGFQELDLSKEAFVFSDSLREQQWYNQVVKDLHPGAKYHKAVPNMEADTFAADSNMSTDLRIPGVRLLLRSINWVFIRDVSGMLNHSDGDGSTRLPDISGIALVARDGIDSTTRTERTRMKGRSDTSLTKQKVSSMYRLHRKMSEEWREVIHWSSDLMTTSATTVERGLPMGEPLVCLKNWVSNVKVDMPRHMEVSSTTVSAVRVSNRGAFSRKVRKLLMIKGWASERYRDVTSKETIIDLGGGVRLVI